MPFRWRHRKRWCSGLETERVARGPDPWQPRPTAVPFVEVRWRCTHSIVIDPNPACDAPRPLPTVIWEDSAGGVWFTVDQPNTQFASLGIPEVAEVGVELDRKLAALLEALDVDVPDAVRQS
jgi:hypothetical protein